MHRACAHSATSGCVTSALMCISIREPLPHPSTQTCTHSRGPVPLSVLTYTRKAPVLCLQLDKARRLHASSLSTPFFRPVWHIISGALFVYHVSVGTIAVNNAWKYCGDDRSFLEILLFYCTSLKHVAQILKCSYNFIFANISVLLFKEVRLEALFPAGLAGMHCKSCHKQLHRVLL